MQIVILLTGGLVVAQLVTLLLTVLLPPAPTPQYHLAAVADALRGRTTEQKFDQTVQTDAPDLRGRGWLVSERSRQELADLLGVDPADVRLSFYTPLPFAGTVGTRRMAMANDGALLASSDAVPASLLILAQATAPAGGMPGTSQIPGGRVPPTALPGRDSLPQGGVIRGPWQGGGQHEFPANPGWRPGGGEIGGAAGGRPLIRIEPRPGGGVQIGGDGGQALPPLLRGQDRPVNQTPATSPSVPDGTTPALPAFERRNPLVGRGPLPVPLTPTPSQIERTAPRVQTPGQAPASPIDATPLDALPPVARAMPAPAPSVSRAQPEQSVATPQPAPVEAAPLETRTQTAEGEMLDSPSSYAEPLMPRERGLFGLAPVPFVEGDFMAALRRPDGRWSIVQPAAEPFPNAWQRRVALWFLIAFAIVAPVGWMFARRMSKPLVRFAEAAEQLGRDPTAPVLDLDGPAEVGRAAHAFNLMQNRLKSFVSDRTAMIGAISHDLRTPLTRLRFRVEEIDDDRIRDGMVEELEEMEGMISSVLEFIRDASIPGVRERLDLRTIIEDVAEDQLFVGNPVTIEELGQAPVDVDVMATRRLLSNLIENAVKYGDRAHVRLRTERGEALVAVIDEGPGLPEEDLERAFEPFYRSTNASGGEKRGNGLGLAVCRSIARAHGGDVRLLRSEEGFKAELRLPLAYGTNEALAA